MTAEQLQAARAAHWRQKQNPLLTLEDAERWLEQHPLCLYLPRRAQLTAPAPSFVEACMGSTQATPGAAAIEQAQKFVDPPGGNRQRGRFEPARGSDRAARLSGPHPSPAVRALLACGCGLEACATEVVGPQGFAPGARVVESAGRQGCTQRCPSQRNAGARADRGCGPAWFV